MEEITDKITFATTSIRVKMHHIGSTFRRAISRLTKAHNDRRIRRALVKDGFKIEWLSRTSWRVDMRDFHMPAKIRMSDRALDRLLLDIRASEISL